MSLDAGPLRAPATLSEVGPDPSKPPIYQTPPPGQPDKGTPDFHKQGPSPEHETEISFSDQSAQVFHAQVFSEQETLSQAHEQFLDQFPKTLLKISKVSKGEMKQIQL